MIQGPRGPDQEPGKKSDQVDWKRRWMMRLLQTGRIGSGFSFISTSLFALDTQFINPDGIQQLIEAPRHIPMTLGFVVENLQQSGFSDQNIINIIYCISVGSLVLVDQFELKIRALRRT